MKQSKKWFLHIQNIEDNEYFKPFLVRYLYITSDRPGGIKNTDKEFANELDFKDMKLLGMMKKLKLKE